MRSFFKRRPKKQNTNKNPHQQTPQPHSANVWFAYDAVVGIRDNLRTSRRKKITPQPTVRKSLFKAFFKSKEDLGVSFPKLFFFIMRFLFKLQILISAMWSDKSSLLVTFEKSLFQTWLVTICISRTHKNNDPLPSGVWLNMFLDPISENQFIILIGNQVHGDENSTINCLPNNAWVVLSLNWSSNNTIPYWLICSHR